MKTPSRLGQSFIWTAFAALAFLWLSRAVGGPYYRIEPYIMATTAITVTISGLVGTFFGRPLLLALIGYAVANLCWFGTFCSMGM